MSNNKTDKGKHLNLFTSKPKTKRKVSDKAFDMMTTAADKTAVDFSFMQEMKEKRVIESILDAEFEKRDYGEQSAWFPTGKFLGKKVPRGVSGIVDALVLLAAGNVQNALKSTAKEEMVTLYRGVDKWHKGAMVRGGKFKGGQPLSKYQFEALNHNIADWIKRGVPYKNEIKYLPYQENLKGLWVTSKRPEAFSYLSASRVHYRGQGSDISKSIILKFEVPKSVLQKSGIQTQWSHGTSKEIGDVFLFPKGISKNFLTKVENIRPYEY